ncbi:MAG: SGNH/GDSL hydrolase family protein [Elusimicrobiota bacterium]
MKGPGLFVVLLTALIALPSATRAAPAPAFPWDDGGYAAFKDRLQDSPSPSTPQSKPVGRDAFAKPLFQKTLVVGASVSSDFKTASPGRRVARRLGTEAELVERARPGATGAEIVSTLTDADFAKASVVVGIDLFFWDSRRDCQTGLVAVDLFFKKAAEHRTPVVVGNIPALRTGLFGIGGSCREALNARIASACSENCVLIDLDRLWTQAAKNGSLIVAGRKLSTSELLPDGLHLSPEASELVADRIFDAISTR